MFDSVGKFLRFPFFVGLLAWNIVFSFSGFVIVNAFALFWLTWFRLVSPVVFLKYAFTNNKKGWEEYKMNLKIDEFYFPSFSKRNQSAIDFLRGK